MLATGGPGCETPGENGAGGCGAGYVYGYCWAPGEYGVGERVDVDARPGEDCG